MDERKTAPGEPPRKSGEEAEQARARNAALRLLAVRSRSRGEMRERLLRKEYSPEIIEHVISRLDAVGLLDDARFAESLVRDRIRAGTRGTTAILAELRRRHVAADTARAALATVFADEDVAEETLCIAAAEKWLRTHPDDDVKRRRRKLAASLARRGFGTHALRTAVDQLLPRS